MRNANTGPLSETPGGGVRPLRRDQLEGDSHVGGHVGGEILTSYDSFVMSLWRCGAVVVLWFDVI